MVILAPQGGITHMAKLTSAALAAHELGLAATFGGILFGETGLGKSVKVLPDQNDRSRVIDQAWRTYAVPKTVGLITTAATWFIGRSLFSGRYMGRKMRRLILAKDIALGVTFASGIGAQIVGRQLSQEQPFPVDTNGRPTEGTPGRAAKLTRIVSILGYVQLVAAGAALALTSALNVRGQKNPGWNLVARALP
jgi:hypothetical protein